MDERPVVKGTLVYLECKGFMPMIFRDARPEDIHYLKYVGFGGRWDEEKDKSFDDCVRREVREELGVEILDLKQAGTVLFANEGRTFNGERKKWDFECGVYTGKLLSIPNKKTTDTGDRIETFPTERILSLPQHEVDKQIVFMTRQPRRFYMVAKHSGEHLSSLEIKYED